MDENTERYVRGEIADALNGHYPGEPLRLKILGNVGQTKWLQVTETQVVAIRELIATGDLYRVRLALDGMLL